MSSPDDVAPVREIKRRRSPSEVRGLILDTAVSAFAANGYGGASISEIARSAGVSESTLFRHFASKNDLFVEAALTPFETFLAEVAQNVAVGDEPVDAQDLMHDLIDHLYTGFSENGELMRAVLSAVAHPDVVEETGHLHDRFEEAVFKPITEIGLHRARQRGLKVDRNDLELTVRATVALVAGMVVLQRWMLPTGWKRPSREVIIEELVAYSRYGGSHRRYES